MYLIALSLTVVLGIGSGLLTRWLLSPSLPAPGAAIAVALAAILPGLLVFHYVIHRPLHALASKLKHNLDADRVHECGPDEDAHRHRLLTAICNAVGGLRSKTIEITAGIAERGGRLAITSAEVSFSADTLNARLEQQAKNTQLPGNTSQQILETTQVTASNAGRAMNATAASRESGKRAARSCVRP